MNSKDKSNVYLESTNFSEESWNKLDQWKQLEN